MLRSIMRCNVTEKNNIEFVGTLTYEKFYRNRTNNDNIANNNNEPDNHSNYPGSNQGIVYNMNTRAIKLTTRHNLEYSDSKQFKKVHF